VNEITIHTRFRATNAQPVDIDDRRVSLAVSSTVPVDRGGFLEVLEHSRAAIDLTWISSGQAPLLLDHDHTQQIGVVETVTLDESKGVLRATVRLSTSPEAERVLTDIRDGIRRNVSIGYSIHKVDQRGDRTIVTRWQPIEVSIVAVPADRTVGVGRSADLSLGDKQQKENVAMSSTEEKPKLTPGEAGQIMDLGHRHGLAEDARKAIKDGMPLLEFRSHVLNNLGKGKPAVTTDFDTRSQAVEEFSLGRFIRGKITNDWGDAQIEREISIEMTRNARGHRGMVVPTHALAIRAPMTTTGVAAPLVTLEHRPDLFIDALLPASFALQAGARMITGLQSDISIPRETSAPVASWIAEGGSIGEGNPAFDNVQMRATMLAARVSMTRKALLQGIPSMDDMLKRSINRQFAAAIDQAVIAGSGVAPIPRGIEATVGINSFAAAGAGAVTWAEVVDAWAAVASDDVAPDGSIAWIMHPTIASILRKTQKFPGAGGGGVPILGDVTEVRDGSVMAGSIMGRPAFETSHATATKLTLGKMSDVLIAQFGGVDFVIDEVTGASTGSITIYAYAWFDVDVRHAQSFCVITGI
jgi:HK97 family phage major capsid protein/HK97 family phage prohead protease